MDSPEPTNPELIDILQIGNTIYKSFYKKDGKWYSETFSLETNEQKIREYLRKGVKIMDCDETEIEATKTIGSTDVEKVLKKLKNKHTKESIILLDYIEKLESKLNEVEKRAEKFSLQNWEYQKTLEKLQKELENKE